MQAGTSVVAEDLRTKGFVLYLSGKVIPFLFYVQCCSLWSVSLMN
jgi:hypothetical protein